VTKFRIIHGRCEDVVPTLPHKFPFIFADPPFNIGEPYTGGVTDKMSPAQYETFTRAWVAACWAACSGVMCLHGPDALADQYLALARAWGLRRIAWVNWHWRFAQCHRGNWLDSRCHCLIYAKTKDYTWNPEEVLVTSDRVEYGDKRVDETDNGGKRLPFTIFGLPSDGPYWGRVQGNNTERQKGAPNQLPEKYLERLIRAYTNPGDLCLDPFAGSGTTVTVATGLGRPCITIDASLPSCQLVKARVLKGPIHI
jgi:site-specific DNA-methyltransferase (adenine-specific)